MTKILAQYVDIPGLAEPLLYRRSARARRYVIRVRPHDAVLELVIPARAAVSGGIAFARENLRWIEARQEQAATRLLFIPGLSFPFLDDTLSIVSAPAPTRLVRHEGSVLYVAGDALQCNRRVTDWLRQKARNEIAAAARHFAAKVERPVTYIGIRDPATRWGSCSAGGRLCFSWRLILAPSAVLRYVAAHEAAHLREMNHSARFWQLVDDLVPDATIARRWLKEGGATLRRYG